MKHTSKKQKILKKLQKERIKQNLNYQNMANLLNISKTYYWQLENGNRRLTYSMAKQIALILNTKPDDLFYDDL